jgi:hypothetical protein
MSQGGGSPEGSAAAIPLVTSCLNSAYPGTAFEVYSYRADVVHVAWKGPPQPDEVRSLLRQQHQIHRVDLNFHHNGPEESSAPSVSGREDPKGIYVSQMEPVLTKMSTDITLMLEALGKTLRAGDLGEEEAIARNLEHSMASTKGLVDTALEKCRLLKAGEVLLTEESFGEVWRMVNDQVVPSHSLLWKECGEFVNARIRTIKDEAVQVLRQMDYSATEAKKAIEVTWEKCGPMETSADVVRKVFQKALSR